MQEPANFPIKHTVDRKLKYYPLSSVSENSLLSKLPFSIRILLEAAIRNQDNFSVLPKDIELLLNWKNPESQGKEIAFKPGRVVLQDFTGVPAVVDLAALRKAMATNGGNPKKINPQVQVDLVIDHSIQVDHFGNSDALKKNMQREFERNRERYEFLKWGESAFETLRIIPPGIGIVHQVNLEYLAPLVLEKDGLIFPDTLVGTDSHTTMINGLGVLGWGVGGIEAEAVMLGQPLYIPIPEVVGVRIDGNLAGGTTATDLVLFITEMLRKSGVVSKFVEFYGPGLSNLSLPDRATLSNMAPEYGATCGYFPVDEETLNYLLQTGRPKNLVNLIKEYYIAQGLFRTYNGAEPEYSRTLELNLEKVQPSVAGPRRPQDRIPLKELKHSWNKILKAPIKNGGYAIETQNLEAQAKLSLKNLEKGERELKTSDNNNNTEIVLKHGSIGIAAITSCTNTSNPELMLCAGLLAKKAVLRGLSVSPHVKTSLAPGSRVVNDYLEKSNLIKPLEELGFYTVGYGCTTCIGNSGPLAVDMVSAAQKKGLILASVLSGNRNFEGRISPHIKANFLASPPLVVAYAIAGNINANLNEEPLGQDKENKNVYLKDIWPSQEELSASLKDNINPEMYRKRYQKLTVSDSPWNNITSKKGEVYQWDEDSSYIQEPNFFENMPLSIDPITEIHNARCLVKLGDSVTTDHISPAGAIPEDMPAGQYLLSKGIESKEFNSFGSRRGNDQVMTRGTFGNIRLRNQLVPETEGGWTCHYPSEKKMPIYNASLVYKKENVPLIILAGSEYGTGSSRDWAAKGTLTLGCKAVIARSYERIHRSNLIGMGILALQFKEGQSHESLGLTGKEIYTIHGLNDNIKVGSELKVNADDKTFQVLCRLDTPIEIEYYKNGGILRTVLRNFLKKNS